VAFTSLASDLTNILDANEAGDVFVRDLVTGTTTLVSVGATGTAAGHARSYGPVISADGRYVAFISSAADLTTTDANGEFDVFVRDLVTGATALVSVGVTGNAAVSSGCYDPVMSADGRYVAFASYAFPRSYTPGPYHHPPISTLSVFISDLVAGTTTLVSVDTSRDAPYESWASPALSADGRYVAFGSRASGLTSNPDYVPGRGVPDVFVRDLAAGTTALVSVNASGNAVGNGSSGSPVLSADGRYVAFTSSAPDLTATHDANEAGDVFVRDLVTGTTTLVSVGATGTAVGNGFSGSPVLSADGRYVAFTSYATDLTATPDTNGQSDVFVRDLVAGTTTLVSVDIAGNAAGNYGSYDPVLSANGRHVAFASLAANLTAVPDSNHQTDVFVAAVPGPPPMVTRLRRFGYHARPTRLVLSFDEGMDPARSSRVANYRLVAPGPDRRLGTRDDRRVWIRSATYDAALREVTLAPRARLALRQGYRLTVVGSAPSGLTDESGEFLDGAGTGRGGSDFVADFGGEALVRPTAVGAAARRVATRRR
jgi:Tol biopolymer transport system component